MQNIIRKIDRPAEEKCFLRANLTTKYIWFIFLKGCKLKGTCITKCPATNNALKQIAF